LTVCREIKGRWALTLGFHSAFLGAAGFVVLAVLAALTIGARRDEPQMSEAAQTVA
jgi:uncharacterized membrane protein